MKKNKNYLVADDLCCCEYNNIRGERSHVLAMLCDCEAVDTCCSYYISGSRAPDSKYMEAMREIEDRCRVPCFKGAVKLSLEAVIPYILLLTTLYISSWSMPLTIICVPLYFLFVLLWARLFNFRQRTRIYVHSTYATMVVLLVVFNTIVVSFRKILLWEMMTLDTLAYFTVKSMIRVQRGPGYLKPENLKQFIPQSHSAVPLSLLDSSKITWVDSRPIIDGKLQLQCTDCELDRPNRSSHCRRCNRCVLDRDHHCVWLDTCIGRYNHKHFVYFLFLCLATLIYGVQLTTTTLCTPEIYLNWFLFPVDCRYIYNDFPSGLSTALIFFAIINIIFLLLILIYQLILISQNVTSQEYLKANRTNKTRYFGLVVTSNINNGGLVKNWKGFLKEERSNDMVHLFGVV